MYKDKLYIIDKLVAIVKHYQDVQYILGDVLSFSSVTIKVEEPKKMVVNAGPSINSGLNDKKVTDKQTVSNLQTPVQAKIKSIQEKPAHRQILSEKSAIYEGLDKISSISTLKEYIVGRKICEIQQFATNTVLGDGNENAKILLIGEAPGQEEDLLGVPFCGRSGELLMNALSVIGLERQKNFYITNNIFWRPPGNRKPSDLELAACKPFVMKIIEIMKPKAIICLGAVAAQNILHTEEPISLLRQKKLNTDDIDAEIFILYHPSYLLRNPSKKYEMYKDLLFILPHIEKML